MPRGRVADPNETKEARFTRLATQRTRTAIKAIRAIGRLNGPYYASTETQVNKVFAVLEKELGVAQDKFSSNGPPRSDVEFDL